MALLHGKKAMTTKQSMGGKARAASMSPEARRQVASKAALERWRRERLKPMSEQAKAREKIEIIGVLMRAEADLEAAHNALKNTRIETAKRLKGKRVSAGIGLREIARRMDRSAKYVHDVENGRRAVSPGFVYAYLSALIVEPMKKARHTPCGEPQRGQ